MASTTDILTAMCPGAAADPALAIYTDIAGQSVSVAYWGTRYALALALQIAHIWSLSQRSEAAGGAVSGMSEGKMSISYATGSVADDLSQTSYGRQLKSMMIGGISVTGGTL
jgi:hypothetical protein